MLPAIGAGSAATGACRRRPVPPSPRPETESSIMIASLRGELHHVRVESARGELSRLKSEVARLKAANEAQRVTHREELRRKDEMILALVAAGRSAAAAAEQQQESPPQPPQAPARIARPPVPTAGKLVRDLLTGGPIAEAALEHGLEKALQVLENRTVPRKQKGAVRRLCERIEGVLEGVDADMTLRISSCESAELSELSGKLCAVHVLQVDDAQHQQRKEPLAECVVAVESFLSCLTRCNDPVVGTSRMLPVLLRSAQPSERLRGLSVLRGLPRVTLDAPEPAEVSVAPAVNVLALDAHNTVAERHGALESCVVLLIRNGHAAFEATQDSLILNLRLADDGNAADRLLCEYQVGCKHHPSVQCAVLILKLAHVRLGCVRVPESCRKIVHKHC